MNYILVNDKPVRENDLIKAMTWLTDERRRACLMGNYDFWRQSGWVPGAVHAY